MTSTGLWKKMDELARRDFSTEQNLAFMALLKKAYENDLGLLVAGLRSPGEPSDRIHQAYASVSGGRFLICYTSKEHARAHNRKGYETNPGTELAVETVLVRDVLNNLFNKGSIFGLVFNPEDDKMVIILKDLLEKVIRGEKPEPPYFADSKD